MWSRAVPVCHLEQKFQHCQSLFQENINEQSWWYYWNLQEQINRGTKKKEKEGQEYREKAVIKPSNLLYKFVTFPTVKMGKDCYSSHCKHKSLQKDLLSLNISVINSEQIHHCIHNLRTQFLSSICLGHVNYCSKWKQFWWVPPHAIFYLEKLH